MDILIRISNFNQVSTVKRLCETVRTCSSLLQLMTGVHFYYVRPWPFCWLSGIGVDRSSYGSSMQFQDLNVFHFWATFSIWMLVTTVILFFFYSTNYVQLRLSRFHLELFKKFTFDWIQKYGGMFRIWLTFYYPYVIIGSPELLQVYDKNLKTVWRCNSCSHTLLTTFKQPILSCQIIGPVPKECDPIKEHIGDSIGVLAGLANNIERHIVIRRANE